MTYFHLHTKRLTVLSDSYCTSKSTIILSHLLVLNGKVVGSVVRADREFHARVLLLALEQVVGHPRSADHVGRFVGADHEVLAGGHSGLEKR